MWDVVVLVVGLIIGFIFGWLWRDWFGRVQSCAVCDARSASERDAMAKASTPLGVSSSVSGGSAASTSAVSGAGDSNAGTAGSESAAESAQPTTQAVTQAKTETASQSTAPPAQMITGGTGAATTLDSNAGSDNGSAQIDSSRASTDVAGVPSGGEPAPGTNESSRQHSSERTAASATGGDSNVPTQESGGGISESAQARPPTGPKSEPTRAIGEQFSIATRIALSESQGVANAGAHSDQGKPASASTAPGQSATGGVSARGAGSAPESREDPTSAARDAAADQVSTDNGISAVRAQRPAAGDGETPAASDEGAAQISGAGNRGASEAPTTSNLSTVSGGDEVDTGAESRVSGLLATPESELPADKQTSASGSESSGTRVAAGQSKTFDAATPDDLKRIKGVGPKLEGTLHGLGVTHFRQIALWTPEDVERVDGQLRFHGRIERDEWIAQAKVFHKEKYGEPV